MKKVTAALLGLLLLTGCGEWAGMVSTPVETGISTLAPVGEMVLQTPGLTAISWEEDPNGYILNTLEQCLEDGAWTVQFWLTENSGPTSLKMEEKEYGQDIRELFSFLDWEVDETYEYGPIGEPGTYQVSFGRDILCRSSDDMICIYLSGESRNDRLSFRADQAEFLCDEIADLWPGLEVNMGRVRVLPQKTKAETGELYVERLLEKLKADGHIADYELREVWVQAPEWLGSSDVFDPQLFVVHADFSLKPANLERSYWREESIWHDAPDAEGWVHYKDWQNMLCIDPRDGLFGMV